MRIQQLIVMATMLGVPAHSLRATDAKPWKEVASLRAAAESHKAARRTKAVRRTKTARHDEDEEIATASKRLAARKHDNLPLKLHERKTASVDALIAILQDDELDGLAVRFRLEAAKMLGELRAADSVDALLENLTLAPLFNSESVPLAVYPCLAALVQIGKPASRKALLQLSKERNKRRIGLLVILLRRVEGDDVAVFLVKSKLKQDMDDVQQANLQNAMKMLMGN